MFVVRELKEENGSIVSVVSNFIFKKQKKSQIKPNHSMIRHPLNTHFHLFSTSTLKVHVYKYLQKFSFSYLLADVRAIIFVIDCSSFDTIIREDERMVCHGNWEWRTYIYTNAHEPFPSQLKKKNDDPRYY